MAPCKRSSSSNGEVLSFVRKLSDMMEDVSMKQYICWQWDGMSFVIPDPDTFSENALPKMFRHSKFSSFVRQLNIYNFHKCNILQWEFRHQYFQRDHPELRSKIVRNDPKEHAHSSHRSPPPKDEDLVEMLKKKDSQLRELSDRCITTDVELKNVKKSQESLLTALQNVSQMLISLGLLGDSKNQSPNLGQKRRLISVEDEALISSLLSSADQLLAEGDGGELSESDSSFSVPISIDNFQHVNVPELNAAKKRRLSKEMMHCVSDNSILPTPSAQLPFIDTHPSISEWSSVAEMADLCPSVSGYTSNSSEILDSNFESSPLPTPFDLPLQPLLNAGSEW